MILTVTLNFALDVTYHVARFERGETARVEGFARQAGGKGVNVARMLQAIGREAAVTGFVGGYSGLAARAELAAAGLRDELVPIADDSRLTLMIVEDDGQATGFSEPGPVISEGEWRALIKRVLSLAAHCDALVVSGSVPRAVPDDCYALLLGAATQAGIPTLLDADGEALRRGGAASPDIVKINRAELAGVQQDVDLVAGAQALRQCGARAVVVSEGVEGMTAVLDERVLHAAPPRSLTGNPTGAGDAASAALIAGLLDGTPWPERLADAAALSAAAVCAPLAGHFDEDVYRRLREEIEVREMRPSV